MVFDGARILLLWARHCANAMISGSSRVRREGGHFPRPVAKTSGVVAVTVVRAVAGSRSTFWNTVRLVSGR